MRKLNKEPKQELFCLQTQIDCQAFSIFGFGFWFWFMCLLFTFSKVSTHLHE